VVQTWQGAEFRPTFFRYWTDGRKVSPLPLRYQGDITETISLQASDLSKEKYHGFVDVSRSFERTKVG
jgi:hypothetical protein